MIYGVLFTFGDFHFRLTLKFSDRQLQFNQTVEEEETKLEDKPATGGGDFPRNCRPCVLPKLKVCFFLERVEISIIK